MPSIGENERKRVVEDLRCMSQTYGNAPIPDSGFDIAGDLFSCLFPWPSGELKADELFDMLADLIERPTCRMVFNKNMSADEVYPTEVYRCSECGELVYTGLTDYCPGCGARVTTKYVDRGWDTLDDLCNGNVRLKEVE